MCGSQPRAHMQEADNSWLGVAIQIKSKRQSKGNNMKIKSQQAQVVRKGGSNCVCLVKKREFVGDMSTVSLKRLGLKQGRI